MGCWSLGGGLKVCRLDKGGGAVVVVGATVDEEGAAEGVAVSSGAVRNRGRDQRDGGGEVAMLGGGTGRCGGTGRGGGGAGWVGGWGLGWVKGCDGGRVGEGCGLEGDGMGGGAGGTVVVAGRGGAARLLSMITPPMEEPDISTSTATSSGDSNGIGDVAHSELHHPLRLTSSMEDRAKF
nr:glycine-rich cell wall structural protein 1.0-like [Arachis hypogaea]